MRARAVLLFLVILVAPAGGALAPQFAPPPGASRIDRASYRIEVTPEMRRHSRINNVLYFVGFTWSIAALLLMLSAGWSRWIRDRAFRVTGNAAVRAAIAFALFSLLLALLTFPLSWYGGFVVPHQFDLTDQSFPGWLWDQLKATGVGIAIGAPIAALALYAMRRFPRRWWLPVWLGTVPVSVVLIVIQPVVIDPLFNDFRPLSDRVLRDQLLDEASRAGIEGGRVYQVDRSRQTKEMNAYVNGIGPTKRIVLWDTLLQKMDRDEILFVMAHEMGHYVLHHIWKGLAFSILVAFAVFRIGFTAAGWATARWGPRWGFEHPSDPASLPLLALVAWTLLFLMSPVYSAYSRHIEHQADVFALELTRLNDAGARSFVAFATDSKTNPYPPAFIEFWRYSHPSLGRRVEFALDYRPWERGQPNRLWGSGRNPKQ